MRSAVITRWRALRPRYRAAFISLSLATILVGLGLADRWRADPWPARAVLKTPGDTWPLAFSPDGRTFLTSGEGGITPWDVASGRKGQPWATRPGKVAMMGAFSPDGKTFAALLVDTDQSLSVELHDVATGRPRAIQESSSPMKSALQLAFTDDGRTLRGLLGTGTRPDAVVTWDAEAGRETSSRTLMAPIQSGFAAISRDGRTLAINTPGAANVQLWDLEADRDLGRLANPAAIGAVSWGGMGFSEDGRTLGLGRDNGTVELWDVPNRRLLSTLPVHGDGFSSTMIRFSPDGRTLASTGHRWGPRLTLRAIREEIRDRLGSSPRDFSELVIVEIATGRRLARAADAIHPHYSPDGRTLATRERDFSVKLREVPEPSR